MDSLLVKNCNICHYLINIKSNLSIILSYTISLSQWLPLINFSGHVKLFIF